MLSRARSILLMVAAVSAACAGSQTDAPKAEPPSSVPTGAPATAADRNTPRIIFLGDSLTAGLGLDADKSYPSLIEERLRHEGYNYRVVNAGVSGDTSAGGLRRLEWALGEGDPKILVVALGGNDGLRGLPPPELEKNLAAIIEAGQRRGLTVILAGMEAPPNYGAEYTAAFRQTYQTLARRYQITLIPFLLQGVAGDAALNQGDGIHPNERGARVVADAVWPALQPALKKDRPSTLRPFDEAQGRPELVEGREPQGRPDPSTGSGSPRATSRGEQGRGTTGARGALSSVEGRG